MALTSLKENQEHTPTQRYWGKREKCREQIIFPYSRRRMSCVRYSRFLYVLLGKKKKKEETTWAGVVMF